MDKKRIEEILRTLTTEQATALYWTCMGKNQVYIAHKIGYLQEGKVRTEMQYVYEKLGTIIAIRKDMPYHSKMTILKKYEIGNILTGLIEGNINNLKNFPMPSSPTYTLTEKEYESILEQYREINSKYKNIQDITSSLEQKEEEYRKRMIELDSKLAALNLQIGEIEKISSKTEQLHKDLVFLSDVLLPIYDQHQKDKQAEEQEEYRKWSEGLNRNQADNPEYKDDEYEDDQYDDEYDDSDAPELTPMQKAWQEALNKEKNRPQDEDAESDPEALDGEVLDPENYFKPDMENQGFKKDIPYSGSDSREQKTEDPNSQTSRVINLRPLIYSIAAFLLIFLCIALAFRLTGQIPIYP